MYNGYTCAFSQSERSNCTASWAFKFLKPNREGYSKEVVLYSKGSTEMVQDLKCVINLTHAYTDIEELMAGIERADPRKQLWDKRKLFAFIEHNELVAQHEKTKQLITDCTKILSMLPDASSELSKYYYDLLNHLHRQLQRISDEVIERRINDRHIIGTIKKQDEILDAERFKVLIKPVSTNITSAELIKLSNAYDNLPVIVIRQGKLWVFDQSNILQALDYRLEDIEGLARFNKEGVLVGLPLEFYQQVRDKLGLSLKHYKFRDGISDAFHKMSISNGLNADLLSYFLMRDRQASVNTAEVKTDDTSASESADIIKAFFKGDLEASDVSLMRKLELAEQFIASFNDQYISIIAKLHELEMQADKPAEIQLMQGIKLRLEGVLETYTQKITQVFDPYIQRSKELSEIKTCKWFSLTPTLSRG